MGNDCAARVATGFGMGAALGASVGKHQAHCRGTTVCVGRSVLQHLPCGLDTCVHAYNLVHWVKPQGLAALLITWSESHAHSMHTKHHCFFELCQRNLCARGHAGAMMGTYEAFRQKVRGQCGSIF